MLKLYRTSEYIPTLMTRYAHFWIGFVQHTLTIS